VFRGALACALVTLVALSAAAGPAAKFARLSRDAGGAPLALQTAVVTYAPADGHLDYTVDLIGAVHVADQSYYAELNERFTGYDAVLFEMVTREDKPPVTSASRDGKAPGGGDLSFISVMQNGMKDMLGLAFQLDEIDYGAANLVHADLSTRGLRESMKARDESLYVYFWRMVFASFDQYATDPLGARDWQLAAALLTNSQDENALKIVVAEELLASMQSGDMFGGEDGSAIIAARNEHAIGVLREQIDAGTHRIGIFYGVAHMPDFEQRLEAMGLVRTRTEWLDAWRLASP
jgi:hypothetical protein